MTSDIANFLSTEKYEKNQFEEFINIFWPYHLKMLISKKFKEMQSTNTKIKAPQHTSKQIYPTTRV